MSGAARVLVVGAGSIGERHARCFTATGRGHVALCEIDATVRSVVAQRCGIADVHDHYPSALSAAYDAVVVATPAHLHVEMATAAVRAGAHVLIEKPLSTSTDGVDELISLANEQGVTVAVAYVYRCHPALASMRAAIAGDRFGKPVQIVAACGQHFPHYRPAYRDTYYRDRATGGGAVQDALTHVINAGQWLVGPIDQLVADVGHQVLDGVDVEDTVHVVARHGEVMGCYSLNQHQAPNEVTITVICTRGTARFEFHRDRWRWMTEPGAQWTDENAGSLERDTLFRRQATVFLDSAFGQSPPLCTLAEGRHTLLANLSILRSARRGTWEEVEPSEAVHG